MAGREPGAVAEGEPKACEKTEPAEPCGPEGGL